MNQTKGNLIVISGPSGAGKSTVINKAVAGRTDVCFSTSVTTRKPRPGETDGVEYFFIEPDEFQKMVEENKLLEHAEYVSHFYGTPRAYVEQKLEEGLNVILDIEVQGASQVYEKMPEAVKVFVIPPSLEELRRRLVNRKTETAEAIEGRLTRARQEYGCAEFYDYIIVNDDADEAAKELAAIITAQKCRYALRKDLLQIAD